MKLLAAIGAAGFTVTADDPAELAAVSSMLVEAADLLVRAGYSPRLDDGLTRVELVALGDAQERLAAERAVLIGLAAQGRVGAAAVLARSDGGRASMGVMLDLAHAETVAAAQRGSKGGAA